MTWSFWDGRLGKLLSSIATREKMQGNGNSSSRSNSCSCTCSCSGWMNRNIHSWSSTISEAIASSADDSAAGAKSLPASPVRVETGERLMAVARTSEFCALTALELSQQEILQVQMLSEKERESYRWTIASLEDEIVTLRRQLNHTRCFAVLKRTDSSNHGNDSGGGDVMSRASSDLDGSMVKSVAGSITQTDSLLTSSCVQQRNYQEERGLQQYVRDMEETVLRYSQRLHEAERERNEAQAELARALRQQHDIRKCLTQRITSLLKEKEILVLEHAKLLKHFEEVNGLLAAARGAERAMLRRLENSTTAVASGAPDAAAAATATTPTIGGRSKSGNEIANENGCIALNQRALEEEIYMLRWEAERENRNADGLRRTIGSLIDKVDICLHKFHMTTQQSMNCLQEISLLRSTEFDSSCGSDENDDGLDFSCGLFLPSPPSPTSPPPLLLLPKQEPLDVVTS